MKNLKKILSLVLVFAMMATVLVIGTGAAFSDEEDINYDEAVSVLAGIGVLDGIDGAYKPSEVLTREQAAKIIAYAMLGKVAADALTVGKAPFTDVAATRWSAGYIAYCAQNGIINGYGNGKFGPADKLTGFQFAKMLLCAIGYGKNNEFTGDNWTMAVAQLGIPLKLFEGNLAGASNEPCTREEAALYAFNAMTKIMTVNYSQALGFYYSGTNALGSPASFDADYTLGYKIYGLKSETATKGGVTGYVWKANGTQIGDFIATDVLMASYNYGLDLKNATAKGGLFLVCEKAADAKIFYNGTEISQVANGGTVVSGAVYYNTTEGNLYVASGATANSSSDTVYGKIGAIVEFYNKAGDKDKLADKIVITEKRTRVMTSAPVVASNGDVTFAYVTYEKGKIFGYEGLVKDDVVQYVVIDNVCYIEKLEPQTGKLEAINKTTYGDTYTIGGTAYTFATTADAITTRPSNASADITYYLDKSGYIVYYKTATAPAAVYNYGLVLDYAQADASIITGAEAYAKIQVYTSEGKTVVYDVINTTTGLPDRTFNGKSDIITRGDLIRYETAGDNKIKASSLTLANKDNDGFVVTTRATSLTGLQNGTFPLSNNFVTSETYFFFYDSSVTPAKYTVYKGYAAVPTTAAVANSQFFYTLNIQSNIVNAVMIPTSATGAVTNDIVFFADISNYTTMWTAQGSPYYIFKGIINGAEVSVKVDATNKAKITNASAVYFYAEGTDGYYEIGDKYIISGYSTILSRVAVSESNYFITTTGIAYNINANTKIYECTYNPFAYDATFSNPCTKITPVTTIPASDANYNIRLGLVVSTGTGSTRDAQMVFYYKVPVS